MEFLKAAFIVLLLPVLSTILLVLAWQRSIRSATEMPVWRRGCQLIGLIGGTVVVLGFNIALVYTWLMNSGKVSRVDISAKYGPYYPGLIGLVSAIMSLFGKGFGRGAGFVAGFLGGLFWYLYILSSR